ncbi:MAG: DUF3006 domain-containing protein [Candidatus Fimenecus sp.]
MDRIENNFAILECEEKSCIQVPLSDFLSSVREGNVVVKDINGKFYVDEEKTAARKAKLFQLQKNIFSD